MALIPYEFAVQMTCEKCVSKVKQTLEAAPESSSASPSNVLEDVDIDLQSQTFRCQTNLPGYKMLEILSRSGLEVRMKSAGNPGFTSGVVEFHDVLGNGVVGVIRFVPISEKLASLEGAFSGLDESLNDGFQIVIHEFGDISKPVESCGDKFVLDQSCPGLLGDFFDPNSFTIGEINLDVATIIGRSCVVQKKGSNEETLAVGIVARSAGVYQNPKMFCTCDGVSIFDERNIKNN